MSYLDDVIKHMVEQKASAFIMPAGKPMALQMGEQIHPMKQALARDQLVGLLRQVTPPNLQPQIGGGANFEFPYHNDRGNFTLRVKQENGALELVILPHSAAAGAVTQSATTTASIKADADKYFNIPEDRIGTKAFKHIDEMFTILYETNASDLHVSSHEHPMMRLHGTLKKLMEYEVNTNEHLKEILFAIAPKRNQDEWEECKDTDFAYELPGIARFRCNLFADRHGIGGVFRLIPSKILTVTDLKLPQCTVDLCGLAKGLVVLTGPTGSGKSTTLAALVDHCNRTRDDHIITIEDPIEFVHENHSCLVNQREVNVHTEGFKRALRAALREDPDIVLVGEMRDLETVAIAIETAETGHLVFGTLHTSSAASTVDRIIDQFPAAQQEQIRVMLSESLKAVVAQALFKKKGGGRIAAWEILLCPPSVANLIREKKTFQLNSMIQVNKSMGMITMNDAAMNLIKSDLIEPAEAYAKVIDKTGLLSMFEKEGIEFHPPTAAEALKH